MKKSLIIFTSLASQLVFAQSDLPQNEFTNVVGMAFVEIPAGSFLMGSAHEGAKKNEMPQHLVKIEKPFYLARFETTQADWEKVMNEDSSNRARENLLYKMFNSKPREFEPKNPVSVSWNDTQKFIEELNELDPKYRYRLPTEAEWEYAARSGKDPNFFFTVEREKLAEYCWLDRELDKDIHSVGLKKPSRWGLYDICGNASEWVEDNYRPDYESDPTNKKTVRGGRWHSKTENWQPTMRFPKDPDYCGKTIGFRLVAELK